MVNRTTTNRPFSDWIAGCRTKNPGYAMPESGKAGQKSSKRYDKLRSSGALLPMSVEAVSNTHPDPRGRRLESWKEIAAYLRRDVTTARRWEKQERLPVYRLQHSKLGSIFAYTSELDSWRYQQALGGATDAPAAEADHQPTKIWRARRGLLVGGVVLVGLLAGAYLTTRSRAVNATPAKISSPAVLPFKNLSGDPTQEYLAEGMTEALIGRLSGIHDLRVISRTSVMGFKDTHLSVPEISKTLGVDAIVEGAVIREGGRVRVHAQLIRGATDEHLWSETYDRELRDALALESESAQSIAR